MDNWDKGLGISAKVFKGKKIPFHKDGKGSIHYKKQNLYKIL